MRNNVWDIAKGVAIVAVVTIHSCGFLNRYEYGSYGSYVGVILRQFLNFAVPVFLFISGYLAFNTRQDGYFSFISKRLIRVLPPYLIISFIFILISIVSTRDFNFFKDVIVGIAFGKAMSVGYFIMVLIQFILITPLIKRIEKKNTHLITMALLTFLGLLYTYITKIYTPDSKLSEFPYSSIAFFVWYPFYHLGFYLSKYQTKIALKPIMILPLIALAVLESFYINNAGLYVFATSQIKISSFILSGAICIYIYNLSKKNIDSKTLRLLGVNSFGIYLIHILFVKIGTKAATHIGLTNSYPILSIILIAMTSLFFSILFIVIVKIALPEKIYKYIIG